MSAVGSQSVEERLAAMSEVRWRWLSRLYLPKACDCNVRLTIQSLLVQQAH
jgi:hypothetical protein